MPIDTGRTVTRGRSTNKCFIDKCDNDSTYLVMLSARRKADKVQVGSASGHFCDDHVGPAFEQLEEALAPA